MRSGEGWASWRIARWTGSPPLIAAVELALVRLTEDFELPGADAASVRHELETMRSTWSRGNACLT